MDILNNWSSIIQHFNRSFSTNFHVSIASVDENNYPTVTPIGSLFLNRDQTGFYFEKYPSRLPQHARGNNNICVLAVNSSAVFWLRALFKGKFHKSPAVKLYGQLGERRKATERELRKLKKRMSATRGLKGHKYLWGDMAYVREIIFTKAEQINLGKMTV
jgi:hypothetical protein